MSEEDPQTTKCIKYSLCNISSKHNGVFKKIINYFKQRKNNKKNINDHQVYNTSSRDEIIEQILEAKQMKVSEVMIPRADLTAASSETSFAELEGIFLKTNYQRLLIYGKDLDDMLGFITLKDFFREKDNFKIEEHIKKATYATRSTRCFALLDRMQSEDTGMAVILDEYGGIEGVVSIEKLMEKILDNFQDSDDEEFQSSQMIQQIDEETYIFDARTTIAMLEEFWDDIEFLYEEEGEYETIGGFVISYLNRIPSKGEKFTHPGGVTVEILESTARAVKTIKIHKKQ